MGLRRIIVLLSYTSFLVFVACSSCNSGDNKPKPTIPTAQTTSILPDNVPNFNPDSAYQFVQKQVDFGPRIPNTKEHDNCAAWLVKTLERFDAQVKVQNGTVTAYNGDRLAIQNIIGRINPDVKDRILLFAHWDTRPFSDQDKINPKGKLDGANDGASGVGVLLEIARVLKQNPLPAWLGVDIIFFDAEDYGDSKTEDSYCLGTQYFCAQVPISNFTPKYGILLDMVGAPQAQFFQERYSVETAPQIVGKVWQMADAAGYASYFINQMGGSITDDHVYVNRMLQIPSINIIQHDPNTPSGFGEYWHTQDDNMQAIDKFTLKAVGQTILSVLFAEKPEA